MTSYMYNPSKKVTELLSQYLEFDPEELRVGIWSGDLSLRNVHLREEAVYPLLNQLQNTNGLDREYQKPPLRFKLLSGTIGSFDLKIPWKSLVWGNGDVRVKLRDVVLVLALETRDETRERLRSRKRRRAATTSMANGENDSCDGVLSLDDEILFGFTEDEENELPGEDPELRKSRRDKKQHNLREAERRALQGRPLGPWLALLKKKADAERAKSLENESSQRLEKESSRLDKWLRGTINDFFWRFLAGLQMEVENFKIVLVQDGVEIGFSIPSISVVPGQQSAKKPGQADSQRRGKEAETANAASALVASAPPEGVVYRGTCDDGEHVDKRIKFTQVGIYVRKQAATFPFSEPMHAAADISTKEFILRPVDLDFSFALFFPYGPAKRKKKINRKREPDGRDAGMQSVIEEPVASISEDTGSSMSSKRRRGKREKSKEVGLPGEAPETSSFLGTDQLTEQTTDQMTELFTLAPSSSPKDPGTPLAASESGPRARIKMNLPSATPEKGHRPRRSSLYGPILATSIAKPAPSIPRGRTVTLPLARPQDMESTTAVVKNRARANDLSARIEGEMNVGSVQLVCSTNHVELLCAFLTGGARLRNGRPSKTIRSVLNQGQALRRSLTITAPAAAIESTGRGPPNSIMSDLEGGETRQFRLELRSARTERSEVIEAWWRYATGAVVWELRQRRRIRRAFQEKFLSFNWERQSYKRDEYVQLFIRHCLMKQTPSPSEEQLEIEDELAIEQILLYRSLARAVHVRGETQFPESILDLKSSQNQQFLSSDEKMSTPLSPPQNPLASKKSADMSRIGDRPGALGRLEVQGEICRQRKQTAEGESLPPNNPYVPWSSMEKDRHSQCDEISFATTKTTETMATAMLNPALIDDSSAMLFSFGIRVSEIELLIVEDEMFPAGSTPIRDDMDDKSQVSMTDVSVLTDDFRYDRIDRDGLIDTESIDEPIMSSTDYLLFSTPEKVLLRIVISPLDLSSVGTVGQFVSLNFSVQQIEALGESGRLFTVGAKDIEPSSSSAQSQKQPPRKAVSISLVRKKGAEGTSLQCDAATVHITPDFKTTQKLTVFASLGSLHLPSSVLQISPREEVRLYVLRQSFQSVFSQINASARIHGLEVVLPFKVLSSNDSSELFARTGPVLRLGMLEMYSGATVYLLDFDATGPSTNEHRSGTRKLRMIEGTDLATATTPLSHKWVIATSGIDMCVSSLQDEDRLSLLQNPIDVEVLITLNTNPVMDFSKAKVEALVKVSPVHLILSKTRLDRLSTSIQVIGTSRASDEAIAASQDTPLPPRLEILSRFIALSLDVQVSRLRVCLVSLDRSFQPPSQYATLDAMRESTFGFLSVVSCFDLGFPHEEALSSAMQTCIDRLAGLGMQVEEAWQVSNTALLNFLEDMTDARQTDVLTGLSPDKDDDAKGFVKDGSRMEGIIHKSVERTVADYVDELQDDGLGFQLMPQDVVFDLSEGMSISALQLFYDSYLHVSVPSMFVANGEGIHLLRLTPATGPGADADDFLSRSNHLDAEEKLDERTRSIQPGLELRCFSLDKNLPFGRGGEPLAVLGSDSSTDGECLPRSREQLFDAELGDVELFVSRVLATDLAEIVLKVLPPFSTSSSAAEPPIARVGIARDTHFLATCESGSVLLASESFFPFSRLSLSDVVAKQGFVAGNDLPEDAVLHAESLEVFNLSPESEMYPTILSVLDDGLTRELVNSSIRRIPFLARYKSDRAGGEVELVLHSIRFVYLHQFVTEFLQYLFSEKYGIVDVVSKLGSSVPEQSEASSMRYKISLLESSVLLPRSSWSPDIVAIEMKRVTFESSDARRTFVMPTPSAEFSTEIEVSDGDASLQEGADFVDCQPDFSSPQTDRDDTGASLLLSRYLISLEGIQLFTSLSEHRKADSANPSFNFFYGIDGRASINKPVYIPRNRTEAQVVSEAVVEDNAARALRCWRGISGEGFSIDVIVDNASHRRILLTKPRNGSQGEISLDVRLSQFCLLLSLWHCNMQELPTLFPYTAQELKNAAEDPSKGMALPEFGTESMKAFLLSPLAFTIEFCMVLDTVSLRCAFDCFDDHGTLVGETPAIVLSFHDVVLHHTFDSIGVGRTGLGSTSVSLTDESRVFETVLSLSTATTIRRTWADLSFGLQENFTALEKELPQPFQLSVFMVQSWKMYNLGMGAAEMTLSDLDPIWKFLEFVSSYYADERHGHPGFAALAASASLKRSLKEQLGFSQAEDHDSTYDDPGKTDFRLWLTSPILIVPCQPLERLSSSLRLSCSGGVWYRYTSIDTWSAQECVSGGLSLAYYEGPHHRTDGQNYDEAKTLIENLSFGFRMDHNVYSNHTDYSLLIPFTDPASCSVTSERLSVPPAVVATPTICTPYVHPHRFLGPRVCEITCVIEVLPVVSSSLIHLFTGGFNVVSNDAMDLEGVLSKSVSSVEQGRDETPKYSEASDAAADAADETANGTFSVAVCVGDLRCFALDPILGAHLPVAVLSLPLLRITASQFGANDEKLDAQGFPSCGDTHVLVDCHFWADYFKLGVTRSWEPLMEAYKISVLWMKSKLRGSGTALSSDSPLHFNISSAFLMLTNQVFGTYQRLIRETFSPDQVPPLPPEPALGDPEAYASLSVSDLIGGVHVQHKKPEGMNLVDRVAFSFKNLTGQKVRLYRAESCNESSTQQVASVTYLDHCRTTPLSFQPSVTLIENLATKEVKYPGLSCRDTEVESHVVDIQVPGCRWLRGLNVDTFGRSFSSIVPRSTRLRQKTDGEWRLANLMKVLVEVGLENGGRQVTIRSLFSVFNRTSHPVKIICHPEPSWNFAESDLAPTEKPKDGSQLSEELGDECIEPGQSYQVPILLLLESLHRNLDHLGSLWLKPSASIANSEVMQSFTEGAAGNNNTDMKVNFSSKAVQLSRIVNESASIFETARGQDVPPEAGKSGVQVSCPVIQGSGDRLAPFCYAVEIGRSPLVKSTRQNEFENEKEKKKIFIHGPVSYNLSIYPPFVVVNLLPKRGRFELMHAVRRTVLWFADLDAGEQVSVHSVGLDAPLLLLINLGFCRTPVGEGALVHHGTDRQPGIRENLGGLKSIGKAGKAVTRQLGKTLTAIGESPDKRGQNKIKMAQNPRLLMTHSEKYGKKKRKRNKRSDGAADPDLENHLLGDGTTYRIDHSVFSPHDVSDETTLVDSIGQKIALSIENVRGGGGQRRISIFCPFWVVNTTEHALRYKQENSKTFVSGTVVSPEKNGARVLSTQNRTTSIPGEGDQGMASLSTETNPSRREVFSGTPGALATAPGRCSLPAEEIAELVDSTLPLENLAESAFMFNFTDELSLGMGNQRICVQLGDGTGVSQYQSDWSKGLSLDSVGISQVISMHCKDGRFLELTVLVYVAPGALSSYTKIVRLLPRYIVVNALPYPIRLWQDSSVFRPVLAEQEQSYRGDFKWRYRKDSGKRTKVNQYDALWGREATIDAGFTGNISSSTTAHQAALYISTVGSAELVPFSLPDSRGQRQLRIGLGSPWNLTASFSADVAGDHVLALTRAIDLKMLPHVSTRASPEYVVALYPGIPGFVGELGVWYETEWGSSRRIIVKAVKKTSYAFNQTDIHVGDELLHIDGTSVAKKTFVEVMDLLRERLGEICASHQDTRRHVRRATMRLVGRPQSSSQGSKTATANTRPLMLRFRTVEERLRRVRLKAAKAGAMAHSHTTPQPTTSGSSTGAVDLSTHSTTDAPADFIKAELKTLHHMMFLVLREDKSPPFQIQNQTFSSTIYYRQKGCNGHAWHSLNPGETRLYAWQEPLKLKRLSVRVASETTFRFTEESNRDYEQIEGSESHDNSQHRSDRQPASKADGRKVTDEEDSVFSTTINVRLEEIGFRDFLPWQYAGKETSTSYRWLELEVDVVGATRVLLIRDVSKDGRHQVQWERHLDSLRQGIEDERIRLGALDRLNDAVIAHSPEEYEPVPQASCLHDVAESAKNLMADFSGATSICAPHQLIVEVIEAIGLSTDTFVGDCNPYAEVRLKSGDMRRSLFRKSDVRRTYFVKKSVKPTWELQTFVFDVPPEAVDVPRGHAVSIRLLNHRALRYDQLLGKAQVDLHTLRNQEPLVGWFPLAGRTGRRELENQLSHWGRGSVRLRLQWIYSIPALLQYFILLSENRVAELQTRLEGLVEQMQQRQAAEAKKMRESDGFKAVRIQDFISISQKKRRLLNGPKEGKPILKSENAKSTRKPLRADAETGFRNSSQTKNPTTRIEREPRTTPDSGKLRKSGRKYSGEKEKISHAIFHKLEERISQQRQNFHSLLPRRDERKNLSPNGYDLSALSVGTSLKSWTMAQVLFNDSALETQVGSQAFHTRLSLSPRKRLHQRRERPQSEIAVCEKLQAPLVAPVILDDFCEKQISYFLKSRETFECAARRSLAAVLHHGGWLTIRPIRALNLPDSYMGMTVKLRYGSQVLVTGTADAKVSPTWSTATNKSGSNRGRRLSEASLDEDFHEQPNDLHIHVTPQKTNGLIRLSVHGEKSQQQLQSKTELGVLYLPLGNAIAACVDVTASDSGTAMYERWFPLLTPREAVPVEGDRGLSHRPPESEKRDERGFKDYYKPCMQLALFWHPDKEFEYDEDEDEDELAVEGSDLPSSSSGVVKSYFNVDLACLSAALIDSDRAIELLSFTVLDLDVRYWITNAKARLGVALYWLQLDHQDDGTREPVVLAPTPNDFLFPVIQVFAVKDNIRSADVVSFDFIDVSVAEFDLTIEESLLYDVFAFFNSLSFRNGYDRINSSPDEAATQGDEPSLVSLVAVGFSDDSKKEKKVYIEQLFLGVIRVNLSYVKGKRAIWDSTSKSVGWMDQRIEEIIQPLWGHHQPSDVFAAWSRQTSDEDRFAEEEGLQTLPKLFAALFPNLSDAPVRLQGKALNHVFESPAEIFHSIRKFYVNETLKQIYKIIGSLDFVGNPTMLVSSLFSGVRDLVVAPSTAFLNSPTDPSRVGMGVAKGTLSLLSHSTSGFFSFCAKVSATAGQAVSTLSLDSDFSDWHRQRVLVEATNLNRHWKKRGVQSVGAMIMRPVSDVVIGVAGGVFGLVLSPVKGYRRNGGAGLTRGLAVGGIGLIARPVVGILDAFAHFTGSIHDIAKSVNVLERRLQPAVKIRLSYTFGLLGILMPYELAIARADNLLKLFPLKKSRKAALLIPETVIHVEVLPNNGTDTYAIATSARVVLIRVKKEVSGELSPSLCWEVYFATDTAISSRVVDHGHSGVALTITLMKTAKPGGKDLREKPVSKLSSLNDSILSPGVFSNFDMSDQEEPDELDDLAVLDAGQDYDHATGRGSQGEKLEWFTILAEYQYRRQLGRLHNAISCLMGDFEAVIRDPALGRSDDQRAEGYSTFSIYHFKKEDLSRKLKESPDSGTSLWLENLPWINERTFQETAKKSQGEQELELAAAREDWTYSKQLEASREEAGPEWLITGRARALYMGKESERDGVGEESLNPLSLSEDSNKNVDRTEFSAAKDDTQTHLTEVRKPLVGWDSNSVSYTGAFGIEGVSEHSDLTNTARVDDSKGIHPVVPREDTSPSQSHSDDKLGELRTLHGSYKDEGSMAEGLLSPRRTLKTREDFMHQSFATAAPFNPAMFSTPLGNGSSSVAQSVVTEGGRSVDGSQRSGTFSQQRARSRSEDDVFSSARQRSTSNSGMSSANSGVSPRSESFDSARKHTPRADTRREEPPRALQRPESMEELRRAPAPEKPASEDRLGRMEALMENLIIFNSEQAVARGQPPAVAANEDISLLRQEIVELRKMLQQRKTNDNAFAEIAALREELAWMKGQLQLNQQRPQQEPSVANSAPIPNQVFRPPVFTPLRPALNATETRSVRATASEPPQELVPEVVESPETPPSPATSNNTGSSAAAPAVSWLARNDQLLPQDLESIDEVD